MNTDLPGNVGIELLLDNPFWGMLYRGLPRKVTEEVDRISLIVHQDGLYLAFHPSVSDDLHRAHFLWDVQHELLHFLLDHPLGRMECANKRLFDLAADICVHQFLGVPLQGIDRRAMDAWEWLPFQSAEYYYQRLIEWEEAKNSWAKPRLVALLDGNARVLARHQNWLFSNPGADSYASAGHLLFNLKSVLEKTHLQWPEGLFALVRDRLPDVSSTINWTDQLHWLDRNSRRTRLVVRKTKRSKRYGQPPGTKVVLRHRLLLAIDTSGSVSEAQLRLFFQEIHRLYHKGAEIDILECDAAIQRQYAFEGRLPTMIKGRGATLYNPAIEWFNEHNEYGGMVYFTDGQGPAPFVQARRPMLWVIAGASESDRERFQSWTGRAAFLG